MIKTHKLQINTSGNCHVVNITEQVGAAVALAENRQGTVTLFNVGSTAGVTTTEYEPGPANQNCHLPIHRRLSIEFHAVLFDLDGTLLDSLADITSSANAALRRLGLPTHSIDEYRYFVGDGAGCLAQRVLGEAGRDQHVLELCRQAIAEEYQKRWADHTRPYPGIPELLTELKARGVPMAVLSNKPHEATTMVVESFFPDHPFQVVRGARPDVPIKPDPTAALQIAAELHVEPQHFIYLGDTDTDMKTAVTAGMFAAGALWGFRTAEELSAAGARVLFETPADVLTLLDDR
jgi:phosphoglycolate phosphatase